ncbi:uncharacterized protein LOC123401823 [Hordeum vulgare subsp. vulgare]|uniref:Predicted protein n=1 Tax=Hordeum vulgare subsp. vulgare TaxID=112509 RepID=F2DZE1_HORVV|nr:uncharacterized protein LOC123401823 [Hordeum vulgare subsp. vulgare]KAI4980603.1 hypothetical protein ZWY2020_021088 [Hordeum vulgare]BAK00463.1 predicted protein [Hordeum vulgare subsp. vulgare]
MSICARMDAPRGGALGKRKEREYSSSSEQRQPLFPPPPGKPELLRNKPHQLSRFANKPPMPTPPPQEGSSKLLAGYLAHEFLKFGTLLGERPPAPGRKETATPRPAPGPDPARRYAEASMLLMAGGTRIPGVVNPTQLGRWLRIKE